MSEPIVISPKQSWPCPSYKAKYLSSPESAHFPVHYRWALLILLHPNRADQWAYPLADIQCATPRTWQLIQPKPFNSWEKYIHLLLSIDLTIRIERKLPSRASAGMGMNVAVDVVPESSRCTVWELCLNFTSGASSPKTFWTIYLWRT